MDENIERWEIAGPEIAEYLEQAEKILHAEEGKHDDPKPHHEDNPSHNKLFSKDSATITSRLLSINPFLEETFVKAGTNVKFSEDVHEFAELIPDVGQQQYEDFVYSRLVTCAKKVSNTIRKNSFVTPSTKQKGHGTDPKVVKIKYADFNKLRAASTARPSETEALFCNEFTSFPECLTKDCHMYHGNKAQALEIYNPEGKSTIPNIKPTAAIIDLSAVVCARAAVTTAKTFEKFSIEVICSIQDISASCSRIDIATDSYFKMSLKNNTRDNRGVGQYFPFTSTTMLPKEFLKDFLSNSKNKDTLNIFMADKILNHDFGDVTVYVTLYDTVSCNREAEVASLEKGRRQEEADTKIIVHVSDCLNNRHKVVVKTGDTDVVTLLLAHYARFPHPCDIMVDFGFGGNRRFFDVNTIASIIPDATLRGLIFFYSFTGCDVTSSFFHLSKLGWWKVWRENDYVTPTFIKLSWTPNAVEEQDFINIEKFVCAAYDPTNRFQSDDINKLRYHLYSVSTDNNFRRIPPTRAALHLHILRSAYAGGWHWGGALLENLQIPPLTDWAWFLNTENQPVPYWCPPSELKLQDVLYTCNCKGTCTRCKCAKRKQMHLNFKVNESLILSCEITCIKFQLIIS